jgi:hypothetical protein
VKQVVSISLGSSAKDYEFETEFLGQNFTVTRIGTDGDLEKAAELLLHWDKIADAIGIGNIKFPYGVGPRYLTKKQHHHLKALAAQIQTPVTMGDTLRNVSFEWALRFIEYKFGSYFNNARVLFLSGMSSYRIAKVIRNSQTTLRSPTLFSRTAFQNFLTRWITSKHMPNRPMKYFNGCRVNGWPIRLSRSRPGTITSFARPPKKRTLSSFRLSALKTICRTSRWRNWAERPSSPLLPMMSGWPF